jgi:hypothetical protein
LGESTEVIVSFPERGWSFEADFARAGATSCDRRQRAALEPVGDGRYRLRPHGFAGRYDVTLLGRGTKEAQHGGDVFATFRWQTPIEGPLPTPGATANILTGQNGEVDSYGVDLVVGNLRTTPVTATARAVVTSSNGRSLALDLSRDREGCIPGGSVKFTGSQEQGIAAAALGPPPFTYDLRLEIDGVKHRAIAEWPDDVDEECSPCVPLRFRPALPALRHR